MEQNACTSAPSWRSRITSPRLAAFAMAAGLGIAACSPSQASTKQTTGTAPMNMAAAPMNMTSPSSPSPAAVPKASSGGTAPAASRANVSINNFAFGPALLSVKAGTTVVWVNNDIVAHTVTFKDVANSPVLNRGDTFSRTFTAPGTYSYICSIHPFMHGTVVVTP